MHFLDFWTELQKSIASANLLKSDSTTDTLQPILKFSKEAKEIFPVASVFKLL